jgi:uncharacterized protein
MAVTIRALYRYPVKGLSAEALDRIALARWECLPQDRRFAIALATTEFDPQHPRWLPKTQFAMLMRDEKLAELRTRFDPQNGVLTAEERGRVVLEAAITEAEGRRRAGDFLTGFLGDGAQGPLRLVEAPGHAFADARPKPNAHTGKYVSLINLASIRALEGVMAAPVAPLRFRANVYFDGAPEWSELEWLERGVAVGGARLRVVAAITRCPATQVDPETARRDLDVPQALQRHFGHNLMGIYAEVTTGGDIAVGDALSLDT